MNHVSMKYFIAMLNSRVITYCSGNSGKLTESTCVLPMVMGGGVKDSRRFTSTVLEPYVNLIGAWNIPDPVATVLS